MAYKPLAFIRRDFLTQTSYRFSFILSIVWMFVGIASSYFISRLLGTAVSPYLDSYNASYFEFALIGVAFYGFAYADSLSGTVRSYQQNGTFEILFLSPTPILSALFMSTLWTRLYDLLRGVVTLAFGTLVFGAHIEWRGWPTALVAICAVLVAHAGIALIDASFVLVTKRGSPLSQVLGMAVGLFSGFAFPIEVLPDWLRVVSYLLPPTYYYRAMRQAMLQGASIADVSGDLLTLVLFGVILVPIGLIAFNFAMRRARVDGSLSQF